MSARRACTLGPSPTHHPDPAMSRPIPSLPELLDLDLGYICRNLSSEFAQMAGKPLLITGGAGFLGYYLAHAALHFNRTVSADQPIRVTIWDSFIRGRSAWLAALQGTPHLTIEQRDMILPLPEPMPHFDWIIHAAGIASPPYYRKHPIKTIDANINGLRNLLDYAVREADAGRPIQGFLFYSSSEIYGDPDPAAIPTGEDYRGFVSCTGPRACYDESKRFGETLCVVFAQQHGIPTKIARPFNNYGPGLKITDKRVIPDFVRSPTRTFCYAADAITGYYKVLVRGGHGEPYNVGIERPEISMNDLANKVIAYGREMFGYTGHLINRPNPEAEYLTDNPNRRCPSIAKAREQLGYDPRIEIDEGLWRAMVWYHHNRTAEDA
jgi:UDP-glucuronate decarboxylase